MGIRNWMQKRRERRIQSKLSDAAKLVLASIKGKIDLTTGGWESLGQQRTSTSEAPWNSYTNANAEEMYEFLSVIYACVKKIADTSTVFPYTVVSYDEKGEKEEHPDHPMLNLVEHPNADMSYTEFMFNLVMHLELTGISYVWKSRNNAGFPDGLWPFPTSWVTEKADSAGEILVYKIDYGDYKIEIKPEDMIIFRYPSPSNPLQPSGPTQACFRDAQLDEARMDYMIELLENMHLPGPVFTQEESWTEDQMRIIRMVVRDRIGKGKRGSPLFVGGPGAGLNMTNPLADMDWPGTAGLNETRMCATYEVPPILIHLRSGIESSTYSNYETAKRAFYQGKMIAVTDKVAAGFSLGLLHAEGDTAFWFEPVTEGIPELQEDQDQKHTRARTDWLSGGLTLDEYLEIIGSEPVGGRDGKMRLLPMGSTPFYPNEEPPEPPETEAGTEDEEEEGSIITEDDEDEENEDGTEEDTETGTESESEGEGDEE